MIEKIETHFAAIGGLQPVQNRQTPALARLESFIGKPLNPLLAAVWIQYQGMMFCRTVVLENLNVPIADGGIADIAGFLPLDNTPVNHMQTHLDLFSDIFVPFAEGLPSDFVAVHKDNGKIYYILHDPGKDEEAAYLIFDRFEDFCLALIQEKTETETSEKLISFRLDADLLKESKASAGAGKNWKNRT